MQRYVCVCGARRWRKSASEHAPSDQTTRTHTHTHPHTDIPLSVEPLIDEMADSKLQEERKATPSCLSPPLCCIQKHIYARTSGHVGSKTTWLSISLVAAKLPPRLAPPTSSSLVPSITTTTTTPKRHNVASRVPWLATILPDNNTSASPSSHPTFSLQSRCGVVGSFAGWFP